MSLEREKEREAELETSMYTNCLLLGLEPAIIGRGYIGGRVGNFRYSNPRMGEQLLYFLLFSLRGPDQSSKDFDKVWPIFDSAQSRDFRKIVQGIISELESQGALPRSNATVSSLATCCGPRFVELLWRLSVHALREVHKRNFASDVASNPLPSSLTEVSYLHAASLLPVTKARIALERRKFLTNANTAVQRQTSWSNLANEITAEFRSLCVEEAYLQHELEKLQDMRNKADMDKESWDDQISSSSVQNSHLVSKATHLWESLLAQKSQHEVLTSGPIEDLIAQRGHRYRVSGTSLLAAVDLSSHLPTQMDNQKKINPHQLQGNIEVLNITEDRNGRAHQTVDVAEILRRWTHALQRIHRYTLYLGNAVNGLYKFKSENRNTYTKEYQCNWSAKKSDSKVFELWHYKLGHPSTKIVKQAKANDGEGPELLRCASTDGTSGHAESLAATLAEHHQHLASIQDLINQLKGAVPIMQKSIAELTEEINCIAPSKIDEHTARSSSSIYAQTSGRSLENIDDAQTEKASSCPALKLPQLFNLTPNSSRKIMNTQKWHVVSAKPVQTETLAASKPIDPPFTNTHSTPQDTTSNITYSQKLRRSVREAALSKSVNDSECTEKESNKDGSNHFFKPLSTGTITLNKKKKKIKVCLLHLHYKRVNKSTKHQFLNHEGKIISISLSSNELNGFQEHQTLVNAYDFRELDDSVD